MPVLPLVESISVRPRSLSLDSRMICNPARSLTDPPGLNHSSLAWISTPAGSSDRSRLKGVFPTAAVSESEITQQFHRGARSLERSPLRRDLDGCLARLVAEDP